MIKRLSAVALLLACSAANAQFVAGQVLTAAQLNSALAAKTNNNLAAITGGTITGLSAPLPVASGGTGATNGPAALTGLGAGTMAMQNASSVAITGGTVTGLSSPLPIASGGTGATSATGTGNTVLANSPNLSGVTVTGSFTATGLVTQADLVTQAANTVLANVTASTASPTAFAMPSCSTSTSALNWTSGTGFTCGGSGLAPLASPTFTGTVTAPTFSGAFTGGAGSFSTLSASSTVSGAGFTSLLSPYAPLASPTFTGTVTTAALAATGTITPSQTAGIVGTTTNNSANAGSVGEFICAQVTNGGSPTGCATNSSTPVSLTSATPANVTSISLTAGDWDVFGIVTFLPGSTTANNYAAAWINTTSATFNGNQTALLMIPNGNISTFAGIPVATLRLSLASTTTVFLSAQASFTTSTETAVGFIGARRRR
jgi:hypothetical protein